MAILTTEAALGIPKEINVGGRLTKTVVVGGVAVKVPVEGVVTLQFFFYRSDSPLTRITGIGPYIFNNVELSSGIFNIEIPLSNSEIKKVFPPGSETVYVSFNDLTNNQSSPGRFRLSSVPFALQVPTDNKTLRFNNSGDLEVGTFDNLTFENLDGGQLTFGISPSLTGAFSYEWPIDPPTSSRKILSSDTRGHLAWDSTENLRGPKGADGLPGVPGAVGPVGPKGDVGLKGATGSNGAAGLAGANGLVRMDWSEQKETRVIKESKVLSEV